MPDIHESTVVEAPASEVWDLLRDFGGLARWYPGVEPDDLRIVDDRPGDAVGATRVLEMAEDVTVREQLIEHSDDRRSYTYTILDYPLPIRDYHATIRVHEVTDTDDAFVEWSARFEIEPDLREDAVKNMRSVYRGGLNALKERFG